MLLFSFYYGMQVSNASWGDMGLNYLKETSLQKVKRFCIFDCNNNHGQNIDVKKYINKFFVCKNLTWQSIMTKFLEVLDVGSRLVTLENLLLYLKPNILDLCCTHLPDCFLCPEHTGKRQMWSPPPPCWCQGWRGAPGCWPGTLSPTCCHCLWSMASLITE